MPSHGPGTAGTIRLPLDKGECPGPHESTTGRLIRPDDLLGHLGVQDRTHVSTTVVSTALANAPLSGDLTFRSRDGTSATWPAASPTTSCPVPGSIADVFADRDGSQWTGGRSARRVKVPASVARIPLSEMSRSGGHARARPPRWGCSPWRPCFVRAVVRRARPRPWLLGGDTAAHRPARAASTSAASAAGSPANGLLSRGQSMTPRRVTVSKAL
jgi:hypothetical protein